MFFLGVDKREENLSFMNILNVLCILQNIHRRIVTARAQCSMLS